MNRDVHPRHAQRGFSLGRWLQRLVLLLILLVVLAAALAWLAVRGSRPQLEGPVTLPGLSAPLQISRDQLGTVLLQGRERLDLARGLGFVHAQERYFEMDLTRRSAAGELSALFGAKALKRDGERRAHRLRARLTERWAGMSEQDRALLQAYADGVNAGLNGLPVRPWQYLLLRAQPQPWTPVDSLLVISEMYFMLQDNSAEAGFERAWLRDKAAEKNSAGADLLFDWLHPRGGPWDAALDGSQIAPPAVPGPELLNLRNTQPAQHAALTSRVQAQATSESDPVIGSNNWAVSGARSRHGGAILADDMHLGLSVPSIWFRAQFELGDGPQRRRAAGVTLPGLPALVVGSNGDVAWGFTNAYGQWFDWIEVPANAALDRHAETLEVMGGEARTLEVLELDGAPIVRREGQRRFALRWIAHQGEAYNLELDRMLQARSVAEAVALGQRAGMPHQNLMVADRAGQIGWTIAGRLWTQPGLAASHGRFTAPAASRHDWLPPAQAPQIISPTDGQLWTGNNRQLGGDAAELLGDGGFDLGARAKQIRDRLAEHAQHDEASLGAIHLDHEARFLKTWAERLLPTVQGSAEHAELAAVLQGWNGRADADQVGYRLVRQARQKVLDLLWESWTTPLLGERQKDPKQRLPWRRQFETSVVVALEQRPAHLLPPGYSSWDALLRGQLEAAARDMTAGGTRLDAATWGQANASRIQHVLSKAIPALGRWLDMPSRPQAGDANMPHVAGPAFGQSQRLVVSPGREEQGWLSMPGGQSGHPLSPYYGAGHEDWVEARPTPLLAGPARHQMQALPR